MMHRVVWLAVLPLALIIANLAEAGFRCGGCSDPCRPVRSHFGCGLRGASHSHSVACGNSAQGDCGIGSGYAVTGGYATNSYSVVEASPASCGAVAADGSYGMSYAPSVATYAPSVMNYAPMQSAVVAGPQIVCEPITGYRTVMESTFVTETQYVTAMETKQETRKRVKQVSKTVPVTVEDFRTKVTMVPTKETKTIEYSVLVPEQSTKTVDVTVSVPVWNEVSESYIVKVPVISDVQETYNVNVARLKDETFTYNVFVPQTEMVTKMQTITNVVPVVKTKVIQRTVPSYSTQSVTKDYGHWETIVEEVAGSSYGATQVVQVVQAAPMMTYAAPVASYATSCGNAAMTTVVSGGGCGNGMFASSSSGCGCAHKARACGCANRSSNCGCGAPAASSACGCGGGNAIVSGNVVYGNSIATDCGTAVASAPAMTTATRRVWVPSVATEDVPVVTNTVQNEEVSYTVYEQQSTQIPYECAYVMYRPEPRTGTKKVVEYVSEPRTRTRKVINYTEEPRTRTRRVLSYTTQTKQETYPVVTYKTEKKTKEISFTVNVPTQSVEPFQTTRYETVTEDVLEEYTVNVQVPTSKEVQVQVCKMVPKLVAYTFNPCAGNATGVLTSGSVGGCGCGVSAPAVTLNYATATTIISAPTNGCNCSNAMGVLAAPCGCSKQ